MIFGNTEGLNVRELESLTKLESLRLGTQSFVNKQAGLRLCQLSDAFNRKIAILVDRSGRVKSIVVGDTNRVFLSDIGRQRVGSGRLRGLRLIVTTLDGEAKTLITGDELTDLKKLRLDAVIALSADAGRCAEVQYAHILPGQKSNEVYISEKMPPEELPSDFEAMITALEQELREKNSQGRDTKRSSAILVHLSGVESDSEQRLAEMLELCESAEADVVRIITQNRQKPDPKSVVGSGKLEEIALEALDCDAEYLIFDRDLTPSQYRAIEAAVPLRLIDRTQLILDIFARRASSLDGKLQVELAQLKYSLPKLIAKDTAMSRLTGGLGSRGPGETKLELNRRRARDRIAKLRNELKHRETHRKLQRKQRINTEIPIAALVGYTNVGKSTLLNALTGSDVYCANRLFATLDTSSRRLRFPENKELLITDTVGFIRELPADLIAAFKATLEELEDARVLIHVIDATSPQTHLHVKAVDAILAELKLDDKAQIRVLNKCDLVSKDRAETLAASLNAVCVSAVDRKTLAPLIDELRRFFEIELRDIRDIDPS